MDISLQLYTVNSALESDLDGGLARLAEIGFTTVEAFDFVRRAPQLAMSFGAHGITAATGHAFLVQSEIPLPDGTTMTAPSRAETFGAAAELGMTTVIDPFVGVDEWSTLDGVKRIADALNAASIDAAKEGLLVGYHNHDHELRSIIEGKPALAVLAELIDPAVKLEVDLYWATAAHVDIAEFVSGLGEQVLAVHVKDGPMDREITTANVPTDQVSAGRGDVPLAAALASNPHLKYAVIEFDGFQGDVFDGVQGSFDWLTATIAEIDAAGTKASA
ncbi:sugar phosphate isomerase/epimerase [Frondihabitans sp. PhB188]|uniref:sugar phosphate isomerase/epimerase family protein n=1 Tax=Frondihabitans sp. PhB188 TaxID=2485200 RepID=UPI000F497B55|nr:sugar phosphate isomerase/epimerase [Frondihabitans sp. PhB188]ROQ38676.1 sugar phosphate isomerase/epimerase [Frondihabitans sp. PhB188]